MNFNKPLIKNALTIKAISSNINTSTIKNNSILFCFSRKQKVSTAVFARELSNVLYKFKNRDINFNISSFIKAYKPDCNFSFAALILSKIDTFLEKSWSLRSKQINNVVNIIYDKEHKQIINDALLFTKSIHLARQYQLMPTNYLGIADYAKEISKQCKLIKNKHLKVKVLSLKDIKNENMGLLQAVNKGSDEPAAMVVLEYINSNSKDTIALVGKGIMNDTGGYELKPYKSQNGENQDMAGSATVFCAIHALASTNAKVNVVGLLPLAKNLISDHSMLVNDIYKSCNGRTVEIIAPDAEGRLILGDAVAYANKKYNLTKVFTVATLSGLSEMAFGGYTIPCWATKGLTASALDVASRLSGECLTWLPLFPEYFDIVNESSKLADCANHCGTRNIGNSLAAAFLTQFSKCDDFVHFDIAGCETFKGHPTNILGLTLYLFIKNYFKK